jgi:hypothetical protein
MRIVPELLVGHDLHVRRRICPAAQFRTTAMAALFVASTTISREVMLNLMQSFCFAGRVRSDTIGHGNHVPHF